MHPGVSAKAAEVVKRKKYCKVPRGGAGVCGGGRRAVLCRRRRQRIVARHDAVAKVLTTRLRSLPVVEEPPVPTATLPGARADLKVEVKARKRLIDAAIVCPATKSVVARQYTHVNRAGDAVKRNTYQGAVQGFVVEAGGGLHRRLAKKSIDEVVAE